MMVRAWIKPEHLIASFDAVSQTPEEMNQLKINFEYTMCWRHDVQSWLISRFDSVPEIRISFQPELRWFAYLPSDEARMEYEMVWG